MANVILLNKADLATESDMMTLERVVRRLNPAARVTRTVSSDVGLAEVLGTGEFDLDEASQAAGWLQASERALCKDDIGSIARPLLVLRDLTCLMAPRAAVCSRGRRRGSRCWPRKDNDEALLPLSSSVCPSPFRSRFLDLSAFALPRFTFLCSASPRSFFLFVFARICLGFAFALHSPSCHRSNNNSCPRAAPVECRR